MATLLLSIPFLLLFLNISKLGIFLLNNNGKFVHENKKIIKSAITTYLEDEEKQSINSIKLLPNTARGGIMITGGDVGGSYHIHFLAYVNDNPTVFKSGVVFSRCKHLTFYFD